MRKCRAKVSIEHTRTDEELNKMFGTSKADKDHYFKMNRKYCEMEWVFGLFHQWGNEYEEFEAGPGNQTFAVVELSDGTIKLANPTNVEFLPPDFDRREFDNFAYLGHQNLGRFF